MDPTPTDRVVERHPFRRQDDSSEKLDKSPMVSEYEIVDPHKLKSWHGGPVYPDDLEWEEGGVQSATSRFLKSGTINLILMLFPVAYLGLAIAVAYLDGHVIHGINVADELTIDSAMIPNIMRQAIKVSVTLWGIGISLIFCRVLNSLANYKVQNGTRLMALEQIVAAKSVSSAMLAPLNFKTVNLSMIAIAALWALSPVVNQALQRVLTFGNAPIAAVHPPIRYLNTTAGAPLLIDNQQYDKQIFTASQLFTSSLFIPAHEIEENPVDLWGNPRIPSLQNLEYLHKSPNSDGWYDTTVPKSAEAISIFRSVTSGSPKTSTTSGSPDEATGSPHGTSTSSPKTHTSSSPSSTGSPGPTNSASAFATINPSIVYSSMFGIPVEGIRNNGTGYGVVTHFEVDSAYFSLHNCTDYQSVSVQELLRRFPFDPSAGKNAGAWSWTSCALNMNYCSTDQSLGTLYVNIALESGSQKNFTFASQSGANGKDRQYEYTTCKLKSNFVQARVKCEGKACAVMQVRPGTPSRFPAVSPIEINGMPLTSGYGMRWEKGLVMGFAESTMPRADYYRTWNHYTGNGKITLLEKWLHNQKLTLKDGRNYQKLSDLPREMFARKVSLLLNTFYHATIEPTYQTAGPVWKFPQNAFDPPKLGHGHGTEIRTLPSYVCNWRFFSIIVAANTLVILMLIIATILDSKTLGPDVMGCISSMTYANPFIPLPPGGSSLSGKERTRKLRNLHIRMQDVHPEQPVGEVAISTVEGQPLQRGRKYV